MFNTASDYAINKKNPHSIIYTDVKGDTTVLTKKDFATEEEFYYWKQLSDEDYHILDIKEHTPSPKSWLPDATWYRSCPTATTTGTSMLCSMM